MKGQSPLSTPLYLSGFNDIEVEVIGFHVLYQANRNSDVPFRLQVCKHFLIAHHHLHQLESGTAECAVSGFIRHTFVYQQYTVPAFDKILLTGIQNQIQRKIIILCGNGICCNIDEIEDHIAGHCLTDISAASCSLSVLSLIAQTEFQRAGQIGIAPGAAFCLIAQLLQCIRTEIPGGLIRGVGKDQSCRASSRT